MCQLQILFIDARKPISAFCELLEIRELLQKYELLNVYNAETVICKVKTDFGDVQIQQSLVLPIRRFARRFPLA